MPSRFLPRALGLLLLAAGNPAEAETGDASRAAGSAQRFEFVSRQMGTRFRLVLYAPDAAAAQTAATAAFSRVTELNRLMSDYDPDSELRRLGRSPAGTPVGVSRELFAVLQHGQQLAATSGGAFDVTVGPVVRLWREARRTRLLPTAAERTAALGATGHTRLRLNAAQRTVTLLAPGMQLDLGGIAKGYAADEALAVLARHGCPCALVAASGDLALGNAPPGAPGWKIELAPFGPNSGGPWTLVAANVGISTSGDAEQHVEIDGTRYSHIVDPATGLGLTTRVAVTVVAPNALESDALATAGLVLVAGARPGLAACLGGAARAFVFRQEDNGRVQPETFGPNPPGLRSTL